MHAFLSSALQKIEDLRRSSAEKSSWVMIPRSQTDDMQNQPDVLLANQHYFEVWINEIYLAFEREWFTTFSPMAVAVTEFSYSGQDLELPFVVGPGLLNSGMKLPKGMLFTNTRVAGPRPYKGDPVSVAVVLSKLPIDDLLQNLVDTLGKFSGVFNLAPGLTASLTIANNVLDLVEALTGSSEAKPVTGIRNQFSPVIPGYYALIDKPDVDPADLSVRDHKLYRRSDNGAQVEFETSDFVLFSIRQVDPDESYLSRLPFFGSYQNMVLEAGKSNNDETWKSTKAIMATLLGMLDISPDLTSVHGKSLSEQWINTMVDLHGRAVRLSGLGPGKGEKKGAPSTADTRAQAEQTSPLDNIRTKAVAVLDL